MMTFFQKVTNPKHYSNTDRVGRGEGWEVAACFEEILKNLDKGEYFYITLLYMCTALSEKKWTNVDLSVCLFGTFLVHSSDDIVKLPTQMWLGRVHQTDPRLHFVTVGDYLWQLLNSVCIFFGLCITTKRFVWFIVIVCDSRLWSI